MASRPVETIETDRLHLTPQTPEHAALVARVMSDWDVVRMTGTWRHPVTEAQARERIAGRAPDAFNALVFLGTEAIGTAIAANGEIGYLVARSYWGRGFATEIARALIEVGFSQQGHETLVAKVWSDNPASSRVLEKLGFVETERSIDFCLPRGIELANIVYRLTRP